MDLTTSPPKSPHTKTETTPPLTQLNNNPLSFTISKLNNRHPRHGPLVLPPLEYKECLKNHAASLGGHALDGCGEFMPGTAEPAMLKCAACGCHRNFHRREPDDRRTTLAAHFLDFRRPASPPRTLLTLGAASPEDQRTMNRHAVASPTTPTAEKPSGRKRFRTRFTREQKEKMLKLSQKLGWKMQRSDEGMVEELCNEIGVGKSVLKVWMHNNKNSLGKRDINSNDGFCFNTHHSINESSGLNLHLPTNASSSSS